MSKLPLRRTRKYRNARCQVHPYMREKFYRTYQRTMGKSYFLRQVKWRENYYQVKVPVEPIPRYHESSDCFEYPNKSPLKSSYPKKYLPNFPTQNKIPESKISNPQKSFDHPRHLNSVVPPPPLLGLKKPCSKYILLRKTHKPNNYTGKWILKMFYNPFRSFEQLLTSIWVPRSWPLIQVPKMLTLSCQKKITKPILRKNRPFCSLHVQ